MAGEKIGRGQNHLIDHSGQPERKSGVVACHNCGNENPGTFMFCSTCGTRISRLCPYCKDAHSVFAPLCPRTGEPLPQEPPVKGKKGRTAFAVAVGTLAIAGSMLILNPTLRKETSYYYYANLSPKQYSLPVSKHTPAPIAKIKEEPCPYSHPCSSYAVFIPPNECPKVKMIEKKPGSETAPRYAVMVP
jgi:hypothetical protein